MADFESIIKNHASENGSIPASAIGAIVTAIRTAVGNEYVDKERYKAKLTEIEQLKEQRQTAEDNATTAGQWKDKYTQLDTDFKAYKEQVANEKALDSKKSALRKIAKDAGLSEKGIEKAVKYADWDKIELDEKGEIKDAPGQIKALRDEWPEHIVTKVENNDPTPTPPAGGNGDTGNGNRAAMLWQQHRATLYGAAANTNNNAEKGDSNK